jgi:hypothetical protein
MRNYSLVYLQLPSEGLFKVSSFLLTTSCQHNNVAPEYELLCGVLVDSVGERNGTISAVCCAIDYVDLKEVNKYAIAAAKQTNNKHFSLLPSHIINMMSLLTMN